MLFGLPFLHIVYVEKVKPGLPLFLFNYSDRKLHGIFEAASDGKLNINPNAWTVGAGKTPYPAQVRVRVKQDCQPLPELAYKAAIGENYHTDNHFCFELTHVQVSMLLDLFMGKLPVGASVPSARPESRAKVLKQQGNLLQEDNEKDDGWMKPKKTTRAVMDAWHKAEPFVPLTEKPQAEMGSSMPDCWDDTPDIWAAERSATPDRWDGNGEADGYIYYQEQEQKLTREEPSPERGPMELQYNEEQRKNQQEREVLERLKQLKKQNSVQKMCEDEPKQPRLQNGFSEEKGKEVKTEESSSSMSEWEQAARERCLQEQEMLRDEREKLKESLQYMDTSVAKAVQKNLELCASAIAQMRQDRIELRNVLDQVSVELELHKEVDKLWKRNAVLEHTQVQMDAEMEKLKLEMNKMSEQVAVLSRSYRHLDIETRSENRGTSAERRHRQRSSWPGTCSQKVYLLGGYNRIWLESVDVFCPETHELSSVSPMLTARSYAAACVLMGHIYVFGGGNGDSWFSTVESYDNNKDEWTFCPPMGFERGSLAGATVGDRIFALGGGNGSQGSFADVECYDAHLGMWISSTSMLAKRFGVAAVELNGALYAVGGYDGNKYLRSAERFDPREALWTSVAEMKSKRGTLSAAALGGKIYAAGGYDGTGFLDTVEVYEPRTNSWLELESKMRKKRAYGAMAVVSDTLYVFGGFSGGPPFIDEVECFNERAGSGWAVVEAAEMGERCFLASTVL